MLYKEDWDKAQERINAWWSREIIDRVAVQVTAPKNNYIARPLKEYGLIEKWTNPEAVIDIHESKFEKAFYGGEAYPYIGVTLGPSIIGAYLGCDLVFADDTSWQKHFLKSIEEFKDIKFDSNNHWYKIIHKIIDLALIRGKDRYFVSVGDIGATAEVLAYMRGPEELCFDLIEYPDEVKKARDYILNLWYELYDEMYNKIQTVMKGSCMWLSAWSSGKTYPLQCDFSAMISPAMFEEFFLPEIQAQCKFLDDPVYHLDGKEAIKHLDLLLEIPELKAIQWCPGATVGENNSMLQWIPLLKKIQAKNKAIHLEVKKHEIEPLLQELSPYGLMFNTTCDSEEEAKDLLKKAAKWTVSNARP